jgi:hypothetical protein
MTASFVDLIGKEIRSTPTASFAQSVEYHLDYLQTRLGGFNKLTRKLYHSMSQPQQFCDFLTEAHWAMVLLHLGGSAEYEPLGESGPDLRFSYASHKVDFHCKRLRNDPTTAERLKNYNGRLVEYGNVLDDTVSVFDRITSERPRNMDNTIPQILAYWSDSERVEEHEFEYATKDIQSAAAGGQYLWISAVIYKGRIFQRFRFWYNSFATVQLADDLKNLFDKMQPWPTVANCT